MINKSVKYIFITGGVVSSLGKGLASASLGSLLQSRGYKVRIRKLDPYLNVDPGTMSPIEHGECFVTDDGAETDLDLGHYERFLGISAKSTDSVTTGKIFSKVIEKERRGDYLGKTVQIIPHVTNEIKSFITSNIDNEDFVIYEIGGTVGDIEATPFLESVRQIKNEVGKENCIFIHLTLVPYISASKEIKTKPTQHSVKELSAAGIQPDILLCRSEVEISEDERRKIALFCNVTSSSVVPAYDVKNIYEVPISYHKAGLDIEVLKHFGYDVDKQPDLSKWIDIINTKESLIGKEKIKIAIVGKYISLEDSYKSVVEALDHSSIYNKVGVEIVWVDAENLEESDVDVMLDGVSGIIVPGGFGKRGTEGKLKAIKYARENNIPFLGICLGMQLAVIDAMRNAGIDDASSSEWGDKGKIVVGLVDEIHNNNLLNSNGLGGTLRLGSYECDVAKDSLAYNIYGSEKIYERHRHRYEVDIKVSDIIEKHGYKFSGLSPDKLLPEIFENVGHTWFISVQFHPELKSKPFDPHPLFVGLLKAAMGYKNNAN